MQALRLDTVLLVDKHPHDLLTLAGGLLPGYTWYYVDILVVLQ